jgi:hypothetical protein
MKVVETRGHDVEQRTDGGRPNPKKCGKLGPLQTMQKMAKYPSPTMQLLRRRCRGVGLRVWRQGRLGGGRKAEDGGIVVRRRSSPMKVVTPMARGADG